MRLSWIFQLFWISQLNISWLFWINLSSAINSFVVENGFRIMCCKHHNIAECSQQKITEELRGIVCVLACGHLTQIWYHQKSKQLLRSSSWALHAAQQWSSAMETDSDAVSTSTAQSPETSWPTVLLWNTNSFGTAMAKSASQIGIGSWSQCLNCKQPQRLL